MDRSASPAPGIEMFNDLDLQPSQIQSLISEMFRIQLCRNDDHNFVQSVLLKGLQNNPAYKQSKNKAKLITDVSVRESERVTREGQILSAISGAQNHYNMQENPGLQKFLQKYVRKMLLLTIQDKHEYSQHKKQFFSQKYPSYMHLAEIMEE